MMKTYTREDVMKAMKLLKLCGMMQAYDDIIDRGIKRKSSIVTMLTELMDVEIKNRQIRAIQNRMKAAKFPEQRDLNNFKFEETPINQDQITQLYSGEFIKNSRNVILVGGTGTGKTHLAIAISQQAVRDGFKARFFNLVDLANQLEREKLDGQAGRLARQMEKIDILILDELGYLPFSKNGGQLIFHLLSKIHLKTSVMITTNLTFSEWPQVFGNSKMTTALLDRVTYQCDIVETGNDSYRMKKRS
jgi:DNA replication protein DnaC